MGKNISFALALLAIAGLSVTTMPGQTAALSTDQTERVPANASAEGAQPSAATPGTASAVQVPAGAALDRSSNGNDTAQFIADATAYDNTGLSAAKFALTHTHSADVKAFAQQMLTQQGKLDSQLRALARRKGITLPLGDEAADQRLISVLQSNDSAKFDIAFARAMADEHQKTVALYRRASQDTQVDSGVRHWVQARLPQLQDELQSANKLDAAHPSAGS